VDGGLFKPDLVGIIGILHLNLALVDALKELFVVVIHLLLELLLEAVDFIICLLLLLVGPLGFFVHLLYFVVVVVSLMSDLFPHLLHLRSDLVYFVFIMTAFFSFPFEKLL
jgi:hypothetical protein